MHWMILTVFLCGIILPSQELPAFMNTMLSVTRELNSLMGGMFANALHEKAQVIRSTIARIKRKGTSQNLRFISSAQLLCI